MVRTFISIDFDNEEIVKNIVSIQSEIQTSGAKLRVVNPKVLHATIEFLGEITEHQVQQISQLLSDINFKKIRLSVKQPGVLPNENHIRVVFCEIEGEIEELRKIQNEIRVKLRKLGFEVDSRPFKPHLTIARVKSAQNKSELIKVIKNLSDFNCGEQEIVSIKLKKSILGPEGPKYTTIHEIKAQQ